MVRSKTISTRKTLPITCMIRLSRFILPFGIGLLLLGGVLVTAWALSQETHIVYVDGEMIEIEGEYETVGELLAAADITTRPEDLIQPDILSPLTANTVIQIQHANRITLRNQNGTHTYFTHQPTLASFLSEVGLTIQRSDQIYANGLLLAFSQIGSAPVPQLLEIGTFVTITIHDGAQQQIVRTAVPTVGAALQEAGISFSPTYKIEPPPDVQLTANLHIFIQRSQPYTIIADGRTIQTRSHNTNALTVLAENGINLVGYDYTRPSADTLLQAGQIIQVIRVTEDFRVVDMPIPYETVWQATDQAEIDHQMVLQAGVVGIQRQRVRVHYENGVEVSQQIDGEWRAAEPINEIIGYGTLIIPRIMETPDGPLEYWRIVRMRVTSYTAASSGKELDDPSYGITASGYVAGTGLVAVDRAIVPFRTYVYVPGYGVGYAGDTGGGVLGRWIDLGYDEEEFVGWSGYVDVYYLTPVPPVERINFQLPTSLP